MSNTRGAKADFLTAEGSSVSRRKCSLPCKESLDLISNAVAYHPDLLQRQFFRITERPIIPPQTGDVGTLIPAPHCDKKLCILCQLFREFLRLGIAQVDSDLLHDGQHFGVDTHARLCAR